MLKTLIKFGLISSILLQVLLLLVLSQAGQSANWLIAVVGFTLVTATFILEELE